MNNPKTYEPQVLKTISFIRTQKTTMKDSTANTYKRMLRRLYQTLGDKGKDMTMSLGLMPKCFLNSLDILKEIEESDWKDSTKKNNMSLMLTLLRCYLGEKDYEGSETYKDYRNAFDIMKGHNHAKQEKQEPTDTENELKDVKFDDLVSSLNTHFNKIRKADSKDLRSALLNMLGHIHTDQVLRNECAGMLLTDTYLDKDDYPKANFIWIKGRNVKLMVIRDNKVRNSDLGNEPKEVWLKGKVNTAINKYVQVLHNTHTSLCYPMPLVTSKNWTNSNASGDGSENISSSHYSQVFKGIWEHKGLSLTTTQLRKVYAMDVRDKYKGNLLKEKEACEKLDHSNATHNLHYILDFS
tara:strand:- start:5453 stop:6511 length:1059 start_codon:yes stop_codon:yes gene_type:complete